MIHESYDPGLVTLSILVSIISSYAVLGFVAHINTRRGTGNTAWIAGGGVAMGGGIWAVHFIGMLAHAMPVTVHYHLDLTLLSLLLPIIISTLAMMLLARTEAVNHAVFSAAGTLMGLSIAAMHFLGMSAMHMSAEIEYNTFLVFSAVLIAVIAATAALYAAFYLRESTPGAQLGLKLLTSLIMGSAIVAMHYIGMAAANFIPVKLEPTDAFPDLNPTSIAIAIAVVVTLIQIFSLIAFMLDRQLAAKELALETAIKFRVITNEMLDGLITIDANGIIEEFNPAAETIFSYDSNEVIGNNINMLMPEPYHQQHNEYMQHYFNTGKKKIIGIGREVVGLRKNNITFPMELSVSEMSVGGRHSFIGIVRDITDRKKAEEKVLQMAHFDNLTNLPNRTLFLDRLEQCIAQAKRKNSKVALLFLDLDGFKQVNDSFGHDVGDGLLVEVAHRLRINTREVDTVSRIGGDEFTIILNDVDGNDSAVMVASKVILAMAEPFLIMGNICNIGCSIGISKYPKHAVEMKKLIKQADEAMYMSKESGKNTYRFYKPH